MDVSSQVWDRGFQFPGGLGQDMEVGFRVSGAPGPPRDTT